MFVSVCVCWFSLSRCECVLVGGGKGHSASHQASTVLWDPGPAAAAGGVSRASHVDGDRCPWDRDRVRAFCESFLSLLG